MVKIKCCLREESGLLVVLSSISLQSEPMHATVRTKLYFSAMDF